MHSKVDHCFKLFTFMSRYLLSRFSFSFFFKADLHSTNMSRTTDAICWQMFFFQSPFEANKMFCIPNKFVLFANHKLQLKCVGQNSYLDL